MYLNVKLFSFFFPKLKHKCLHRQQNTQKSFDCVYFSDKIYLILYPEVENSITHLTLIHTIF